MPKNLKNSYSCWLYFALKTFLLSLFFNDQKAVVSLNTYSRFKTRFVPLFIFFLFFSVNQDLKAQSVDCTGKANFVVWNGSNQTLYRGGHGGQTPSQVVYDNKLYEGHPAQYQWYNHNGLPGSFSYWVFQGNCITATAPTITTTSISSITCSSASSGGESIDDGDASITAKGVCWSTSSSPTTSDNTTSDGTGTSSYASSITGLAANTTYYVRAYATNSEGTSYGAEVSFTTSAGPSVSSSSGGNRCGTGTVDISATASAGSIDWYAASSGGASLGSSSSGASWTTPSISTTTTYYAEAVDGSCTSASRTAVTATVTNLTISSTTDGSRTGTGTVDLSATTSGGDVKWYAASSGGSALATTSSGATWTTPSISTTTTYYAEADDGTCTSASRSAVTASVVNPPGGVGTNLRLWLKADAEAYSDAGTTLATDGQEVQEFHDQSGNSYDATDNGATGPDWDEDGVNFNPSLDFEDANSENLEISSGIFATDAINDLFIYAVFADDEDRSDNVFREEMASSRVVNVHCAWSNEQVYWDMGNTTDGQGRVTANWGTDYGITHLWAFGSSTVTGTPNGTKKYILRDNTVVDSGDPSTANSATGNNQIFFLGSGVNTNYLNGRIAELVMYDGIPTETQEDQIQTYLAVKYGITLAGEDYTHSDGSTVIWDYSENTAYHYDIAGIGADATSGLDQRISKSINSDAIVTMCTEAIGTTNAGISTALTDDTYLLWGNNNAKDNSAHDDLPSGYSGRLAKEWKVEMTGTVADVHVEFDLSGDAHITLNGDAAGDFYLLIDSDGDFTSGATATAASSFSANKVTFNDIDFTDGYYFTLATQQPGPGGVSNNMEVWFDAGVQSHNTGTTQATDGQDVDNWHDQSGNDHDATSNEGDASWDADGMNYNPTLYFDGGAENYLISGGIIDDDDTLHNMFTYFVGTLDNSSANTRYVFYENTDNSANGGNTSGIQCHRQTDDDILYDKGRNTGGTGRTIGDLGTTVAEPMLLSMGAGVNTSGPGTNEKYITKNNVSIDDRAGTSYAKGNGDNFYIGSNNSGANEWIGNMAELIILNTIPTAAEEDQIQSYLAIKYGITLSAMDYLSANGTVVWDNSTYNAYHYDIAGIGRDDLGNLLQKQSKSSNADAIVTMSTEAIAATNAANSTTLTDGAYLLWGNNNASTSANTDLPSGYTGRLQKEWVVEMTGTVSNVHVQFDLPIGQQLAGDEAGDYYILIDADGDFTSGATATVASSFSTGKVTFDDVNFTDGQYFTLATTQTAPGAVATHLEAWYKADAQAHNTGTTLATDGQTVDNWHDQSGLNHDATSGTDPDWDEDAMNFNPALDFEASSNEYLAVPGGLFGTDTRYKWTAYAVTNHESTANSPVFAEELSGGEELMFLAPWTTDDTHWRVGSSGNQVHDGTGFSDAGTGVNVIWSMGAGEDDNTPGGEEMYTRLNGVLHDTRDGYETTVTGAGNDFQIGKWHTNTSEFDGKIAELILYDGIPSALDEIKIQSYLAVKYGITLSNDNDSDASAGEAIGSITEGDYVGGDGSTVLWDYSANSTYHYDIAGLGRDDDMGLHQKQSKSSNSDAIVTMSTEAIGTTNAGISTALTDGAYLLWGNNDASSSAETDMPSGYTGRLEKEWKVQMTGTVSNVHVEFDLAELHNLAGDAAGDYYLLIDSDGDFTSGASETAASTLTGNNKITFNDINFTDGYYFTLGTKQPAPGGVGTHLQAWWKADAGTATTTDDASNASWTDQSSHGFVANQTTTGADYWENGINFNPILRFTENNEDFTVTNGIYGNTTRDNMFSYVVATRGETGDENVLFMQEMTVADDLFGMLFWSNDLTFYYEGDNLETSGRISASWGGTVNQPHLWASGAAESTSTPGGNFKYLMRDNTMYDNTTGTSTVSGGTNDFRIGCNQDGIYDYNGDIAEIIILDGIPSALEQDQIQSYLAIKYGITLASSDYYNSAGTVIWDNSTYSAYHYDVAGIGRDDNGSLLQKQSKSVNSDAIVTMSTEAIATDNNANSTTLTDGAYLLWGNNNASTSSYDDLPEGYSGRLDKEWVVEMTGTVSNVHVEFDITDLRLGGDVASDFYLLTDADGNFTVGASATVASSFSSNKVTFDDVNFSDGQYFTLATQEPGPGGVSKNLLLWLKADDQAHNSGTTLATDGQDVDNWHDQSGHNLDADDSGGNSPTWDEDAINFNPAIDFTGGATGTPLDIPNGIIEGGTKTDMYVYTVVTTDVTQTQTLFWQDLNTGNTNEIFSFIPHYSNSYSYWDNGNYSTGRAGSSASGVTLGQPHLFSLSSTTSSMEIKRDNNSVATSSNTGVSTEDHTQPFYIGYRWNNGGNYFDGKLAELIIFEDVPTATERAQIESYLAMKYGIQMDNGFTYYNSSGGTVWSDDATFDDDFAMIGRDDLSEFDQRQGKSMNSDAVLTMSTQAIATTNAGNTTQLGTDKSFEMWANNGGSVAMQTSELHTDFTERLGREWLVQETGTVGDVVVEVDLTGVSFSNTNVKNFALVIDDDGTFTGGTQSWVAADTYSSNKVTFNAVNFSNGDYFTVMNTPNALPVELTYFEGKRIGSHVLLEWETMAEVNNDYFIVEKSTDGENWTELLTVDGQGNSSEPTYYSQIDIDGCEGVCYYKLIQVDFGGESKEEKIVAINSGGNNTEFKISVSPNPINQIANIAFSAPEGGMFNLTVTNQAGQVMYTAKTIGDKGNNHIAYNASNLSKGSYYFILEDENGNRTQQLAIK